jgi:hypothetical protein
MKSQSTDNCKMKEENENIEHRLEGLKNGREFRVPENYFDNFAERLRARIEEERKPVIKLSWFTYLKPALGIAAVLTIALLLIKVPVKLSLREQKIINENSLTTIKTSNETATSRLSDELAASFESLVQLPQSQFLSTLEADADQDNQSQIDQKALEEYLADNSIDYDLIRNN